MENATKNQHFISQSEQRSNCIDESVSKDKRRIFKFSIVDREEHSIRLDGLDGVKIKKNLSFSDLFSFDVQDVSLRKNLETFFHKHEVDLDQASRALIAAAQSRADIATVTELAVKVLKSKLMGIVRNPFCISGTTGMFNPYLGVNPTDPQFLKEFKTIRDGVKPHLEKVCLQYEVSPEQYLDWLQIIFLSLMIPPGADGSMLESMADSLMDSPGKMCHLIIATFDDVEGCRVALPDTSYLQGTQDPHHNMFMFNLNKNAYAAFSFVDVAKQTMVPVPAVLRERGSLLGLGFSYQIHHNDMQVLENFNALAVYQSKNHVFCADKSIYGVNCLN
ncbi:hypothetical protein D3C87_1177290 [compost metagenome]